jgi:UDP-N-acetylmuramoyl-tripeptide--D-alanyl-D-alanine ligase
MAHLTLPQLHEAIGGELLLSTTTAGESAAPIGRVVVDSRQVQPRDIFWALPGLSRDGADFLDDAFRRGAAGVVTARTATPSPGRWLLKVADPLLALWNLARWKRRHFAGRLIAVTGSVGKTTTRLMIDAVLGRGGQGSTSPHNYNNHIGLPLSMLGLAAADDYAVYELGASACGEIAELAGLCQPQIGVITCIGDAHLGGFGSRQALADAKAELLESLPADGLAVLWGEDPWLRKLAHRSPARIVWVGRGAGCDLVATHVRSRQGKLSFKVDGIDLDVPVWGRHYLPAVGAAVAVGREFGVPAGEIADALAGFEPPRMRCQVSYVRGATLINDTYNASPTAMRAALELLCEFEAPGRRIVVCGDMRELGAASTELHRRLGDEVVTVCGADLLLACGGYAEDVVSGARRAGMHPRRAIACRKVGEAAAQLKEHLAPGDVVLVKGSRALALEQVIEQLQDVPLRRAA